MTDRNAAADGRNTLCVAMVRRSTNEKYVIIFDRHRKSDALRQIGRWAGNPDLSLTWNDAAYMASGVMTLVEGT